MFKEVSTKVNFPTMEEEVLAFWEQHQVFQASLDQRKDAQEYVFYDGPPFATGLPHYGHLLAGTIKDIVPRYHTMRGHYVERRFGWDCHGLPIEALAQEALGLAGAGAIQERGVEVFNEQCRSMVLTYVEDWRQTVTRMGRWVDFENDYKTMDPTFMETIWWVFKQLWEQGRIYKAYRIMPYSWKLTTPLSNFEAGNNYQDVQDPAITVRFRVRSGDAAWDDEGATFFLAWTTTPWTLPGNLALGVGPDIEYVRVRDTASRECYLLARERLAAHYPDPAGYEVLNTYSGSQLAGWTYEPLFPYFEEQPGAFRLLVDPFVSTEEGTGLVHLAPAYGEDDYRVCRAAGIDLVDPLDMACRFTGATPEYEGQFCKDADKAIIARLKQEGKLVHQSTVVHSYPFCERTDTPLIYRAIDAWYVRVEDLREELVENNRQVRWVPAGVGEKRFANWLTDAKDWNISRNRFWGSCIPVWISEDGTDQVCVGSVAELEALSGQKVTDLHKHVLDEVTFERNGQRYRRTPEVLDCWFESGSMPYAQSHYPFENKERFEGHFPADFIAEGLDQTRGWFYTLTVLSTALFKKPAFKNVVVNGLVLAEDGLKMSKRLKNYPDPMTVVNTYGADALRLYLINSPVVKAEDLCFTEEGVKHSLRHLLLPWWNAYAFFVTYARIDHWTPEQRLPGTSPNLLDRWILSSLEALAERVVGAMDRYDLQRAVRPFVQFIEDLTNWYIRRSRRRFWKSSDDDDKLYAYGTLYDVLMKLSRIAAPFLPFISEAIFQNLRDEGMPRSVHLCDFPEPDGAGRDRALNRQMATVMAVVSLGRTLRAEYDLKVRQPLQALHVVCHEAAQLAGLESLKDLITDELNVREVAFSTEDEGLATLAAKPNFKTLGPRLGPAVKQASKALAALSEADLRKLAGGQPVEVRVGEQALALTAEDVVLTREPKPGLAVKAEGHLVVALEVEMNADLLREGLAREMIHRVQNLRKERGLAVTQRIALVVSGADEVKEAVAEHGATIQAETLAVTLDLAKGAPAGAQEWEVNGHTCHVKLDPCDAR